MQRYLNIVAMMLCLGVAQCAYAQVGYRPLQNVRRVVVTFKYEVHNGKRTGNSCVVRQEIKDSLNRLHTILDWDCHSAQVKDYVWHTFNGSKIVCTQTFRNGQLIMQQDFTYSPDSALIAERITHVTNDDTALYATVRYTWRGNTRTAVAFGPKGKRVWRSQSTYNSNGIEISRKTKISRGFAPLDSIAVLRRHVAYDSLNRLTHEQIEEKRTDGRLTKRTIAYSYNTKGQLFERTVSDANGQVQYSERMEYSNGGALKTISKFDAQGVLIDYHFKRYEVYPTADRQQRHFEHM